MKCPNFCSALLPRLRSAAARRHRVAASPKRAQPALIEALEDRIAPATFIVTTAADSGAGSLRAALASAEADALPDTIVFNIPGPGIHTIPLLTALPKITHPVTIDGASEAGYIDQPVIELNGEQTVGASGLLISSGDVTIKALTINRFDNSGVYVLGGSGNVTIQGCFIGVDATGSLARPNDQQGILITAPNCHIGGGLATERNVVSGNGQDGIAFSGVGASGSTVQGNYVGTNLLASLQIPNGGNGISLSTGGGHTIGGMAPGQGNVISGNLGNDVEIYNSSENTVAGNIIGLDLAQKVELQSQGHGINLAGSSAFNIIGGTAAGARNVIAAHDENNRVGLNIDCSGSGNTVLGNLIGTGPTGDNELQNAIGIYVSAPGTTIGDLAGHGNFIAGNVGFGLQANGAQNLQILGNHIGIYTDAGDFTLPNGGSGVSILGGTNVLVKGNVISGNSGQGVTINNSLNAVLQGNFIGTNSTGTQARPNTGTGLAVVNCPGLLVGGTTTAQANLLSGNGIYGLDINSTQPVNVFGNLIGVDAAGTSALPDGDSGIRVVGGSGHHIGGAAAGQGNVVSGSFRGVQLATSGNFVQGNIIGLNKDASNKIAAPAPDASGAGVYIYAGSNNTIGGLLPGEGNIIAGNVGSGVLFNGGGTGNKLHGNLIGTNTAGAPFLGNGGVNPNIPSVLITTPGAIIGGPGSARNIIASGSGRALQLSNAANALVQGNWIGLAPDGVTKLGNLAGIALSGSGTTGASILGNVLSGSAAWALAGTDNGGHLIQGNRIGTNAAGTALIANGQQGITLTRASNVTIGGLGAGQGNLIAGSGIDAILLTGGTNVMVQGNFIGTDATGTKALPNQEGISINSSAASFATNVLVSGNVIAATKGSGINLSGAQSNTRVQSNLIGLAFNGVDPLPNGQGIAIGNGSGLLIGGTPAQGNTIAYSKAAGIGVFFAGSGDIQILSNTLRQNTTSGLSVSAAGGPITVGAIGQSNTITGNLGPGVLLDQAQKVTVQSNVIQANGGAGVLVQKGGQLNTIGGSAPGLGNLITANSGAGVAITTGTGTAVSRNLISGNLGLAIDLGATGPTANDTGDVDTGANGLQNGPVLTGRALLPSGDTLLLGELESTAGTQFRLEFFSGAMGQAEQFLAETIVTTGADGVAHFQASLGLVAAGDGIIATATNLTTGETSELGGLAAAPAVPNLTISSASVTEGQTGNAEAVFTVTLSSTPTLPVSFQYHTEGGTAISGGDFAATSGTFTFPAGATSLTATLTVPVLGDLTPELAEHFLLQLTEGENVYLLGPTGEATILNDDSTLTIDLGHKLAHWRDLDGDLVTLKVSKPVLSPDDFVFLADGQGGEQLTALLLSDDGAAAAGTKVKLTARRDPLHPLGNGRANLGLLDATGVDLGAITVSGDLGCLMAGDGVLTTPGLLTLKAGSLGFYGLSTQGAGGSLQSEVQGSVGSVIIRGDMLQAGFHATGKVGKVRIAGDLAGGAADFSGSFRTEGKLGAFTLGGSLVGGTGAHAGEVQSGGALGVVLIKGGVSAGAHISSGGALGAVTIGGSLAGSDAAHQAVISAAGSIQSVQIGGSVSAARVLAGYSPNLQAVNPDAKIGAVVVTDNWSASDLAAGIDPGADKSFGTPDDHAATPSQPFADHPALLSKIASIRIGGYVAGSAGDSTDHFAFTAQRIGQFSIGALAYVLQTSAPDVFALGLTNDLTLSEVG